MGLSHVWMNSRILIYMEHLYEFLQRVRTVYICIIHPGVSLGDKSSANGTTALSCRIDRLLLLLYNNGIARARGKKLSLGRCCSRCTRDTPERESQGCDREDKLSDWSARGVINFV